MRWRSNHRRPCRTLCGALLSLRQPARRRVNPNRSSISRNSKIPASLVSDHPTMAWTLQQLREARPFGEQPKFLIRDNDSIYGKEVINFLAAAGVKEVRTAYRSPWQNPFVERFIGSLRRELLDHIIPPGCTSSRKAAQGIH
jgi:transposase InsO family protein